MKNAWKMLILIIGVLILCASILAACNSFVNPDEGQVTINPTDSGESENNITEPTQDQTATNPVNDNSNIMDGNDHVEAPFG